MARKTIYCEYEFWKNFSESFPSVGAPDESLIKKMQCWMNTFDSICKSDIHIDINISQLKEKMADNDSLKRLWKKHVGGYCDLSCDGDCFPEVEKIPKESITDAYLRSVFFSCMNYDNCKSIMEKYGIMIFNTDSIMTSDYLFKDCGMAVKKGDHSKKHCWENLREHIMHPCNSLIIVDNYVLSDTKKIDENLMSILDLLIPRKKLDIPFHLSIYTFDMKNQAKNRYIDLKRKILNARKDWTEDNIKISVYKCGRDDFHDRAIITNNMWISCGGGFDLLSRGISSKTTTISICYPFIQTAVNWLDEAYSNVIDEAAKFAKKDDLKSLDELD